MATEGRLSHEFSVAWIWFKMTVMNRMEDAWTFFPIWLGSIVSLVISIIFFKALFLKTTTVGGWSFGEVMVLLGTVRIVQALAWGLWYRGGFRQLPRAILRGDLDAWLVKPINLRIQFIFNNADVMTLVEGSILGAILIWYGMGTATVHMQWTMFLFMLACASIIHYSLVSAFATLNFWTPMPQYNNLTDQIFNLGRYPITIYRGAVQWILTVIIPLGCIYTFPAQALLGNLTVNEFLTMLAVTAIFWSLGYVIWRRGLRHYESALS